MAGVLTKKNYHLLDVAGIRIGAGTFTFDNAYATGGLALDFSAEFDSIFAFVPETQGGYVFEYDKANKKLKAYRQKDPAAAGGADIPLPEVANAFDLSAVKTVGFIVVGVKS